MFSIYNINCQILFLLLSYFMLLYVIATEVLVQTLLITLFNA